MIYLNYTSNSRLSKPLPLRVPNRDQSRSKNEDENALNERFLGRFADHPPLSFSPSLPAPICTKVRFWARSDVPPDGQRRLHNLIDDKCRQIGGGGRAYRRVKPLGARLLPIRFLYAGLHALGGPFGARPNSETLESRHVGSPNQNRRCDTIHPSIHLCANPNIPSGTPFNGTPVAILSMFPTPDITSRFLRCHDSDQHRALDAWRIDQFLFPGSCDRDFSRGVGLFLEKGRWLDIATFWLYCGYHNLSVLLFVYYLVCIQKMCVFMHVIV